jgi:hypothetical protein
MSCIGGVDVVSHTHITHHLSRPLLCGCPSLSPVSPRGAILITAIHMADLDYIEVILLLLPLVTIILIEVWDYISTLYGVAYGGAVEINPAASALLKKGAFDALMWWKGVHILLNVISYVAGVGLYFAGKAKDVNVAKYTGAFFLILFFISYFVGLIAITLNIMGLAQLILQK